MFERVKRYFQVLLDDEPGKRFQRQFERRHLDLTHPLLRKILFIGGGAIVVAVGILMLPLPGSGTVIIVIGLGLIAQESLHLSKILDWLEIKTRRLLDQGKSWWDGSSIVIKVFLIIIALAIFGLFSWGLYLLAAVVSIY